MDKTSARYASQQTFPQGQPLQFPNNRFQTLGSINALGANPIPPHKAMGQALNASATPATEQGVMQALQQSRQQPKLAWLEELVADHVKASEVQTGGNMSPTAGAHKGTATLSGPG